MAYLYKPVSRRDGHGAEELDVQRTAHYRLEAPWRTSKTFFFLTLALLSSCMLNVYQFSTAVTVPVSEDQVPSKYAGLYRNIPTVITKHSEFDSMNRTVADLAWARPELEPEVGTLAVTKSWAAAKGLPPSQTWPWDKTKSIYILESFHHVHCLHALRETVQHAYSGAKLRWPEGHLAHCLNLLLQNTMCNAEDTLLYTGRVNAQASAERPAAGIGDVKMCRSWTELQAFARRYSACFGRDTDPAVPAIELYKACPDGSKPWEENERSGEGGAGGDDDFV